MNESPNLTEVAAFLAVSDEIRCVFDTSGKLLAANERFFAVCKRRPAEMVGRPFWDFLDPQDLGDTLDVLNELSMDKGISGFENRYLSPSGEPILLRWDCEQADDSGRLLARATLVAEHDCAQVRPYHPQWSGSGATA